MSMIRKGSMVLSTAPTNFPHPWKVEWARGDKFRCFVGKIHDASSISTQEWLPKNFPEALSQGMTVSTHSVSPRYLQRDRTSMNKTPYQTAVKSGSLKIYSKTSLGRVTSATAVLIDESKGCAEWAENVILPSNTTTSVYFVLHKTDDKWMISAVKETDLVSTDIKLAVVKQRTGASIKDWRLIQLWKSDLFVQQSNPYLEFMFQLSVEPSTTAGEFKVKVGWDEIFDDNQLSEQFDWTNSGPATNPPYANLVHNRSLDWIVPTYNGTPMSPLDEENPEITITETTYFYFQFNRYPAAYQNTNINPDDRTPPSPSNTLWIKDFITSATIETSDTSITENATIFDPENCNKDYFRMPIGKVEITPSGTSPVTYATKVTMSTGLRYFLGTRMKTGLSYFGLGTPEVWEKQGDPPNDYWVEQSLSSIDPDANYIQYLYVPRARYPV